MQVVYTGQTPPITMKKSLFLAGPSPRNFDHLNWRTDALKILEDLGYDEVVFVPLPEDGQWPEQYEDQVDWETKYLHMADQIVFWVPRDLDTLPAFTTNVEFGAWCTSGKVVLGFPEQAPKMRYLACHAQEQGVPVAHDLRETLLFSLERIGQGAERTEGEREIPLFIWKTKSFQNWYQAQQQVGNRLDGAKLLWTFRVGPEKTIPFLWALHVRLFIASEGRTKVNEVVISRPDISTVVAFVPKENMLDSTIALVREFRSPAATTDGFIHEVPGGSSWNTEDQPQEIAVQEFSEETGFSFDPSRLRLVGTRQIAGTLYTPKAHVYALELSEDEMEVLQKRCGIPYGVEQDSERTYLEIYQLRELLHSSSNLLDWTNLGMIFSALQR